MPPRSTNAAGPSSGSAARGCWLPFTTPALAGARGRLTQDGDLEVVLPSLPGKRSRTVIGWRSLVETTQTTLHDRVLRDRIVHHRADHPIRIRTVALSVAARGVAGLRAKEAAELALANDAQFKALTEFLLVARLYQQLGLTAPEVYPEDFLDRVSPDLIRAGLLPGAERLAMPSDQVLSRLDMLGGLLALLGTTDSPEPGRIRAMVDGLREFTTSMRTWRLFMPHELAEPCQFMAAAADATESATRDLIRQADESVADVATLFTQWDKAFPAILRTVFRLAQRLDGWEPVLAMAKAAPTLDRQMLQTLILELFLITPPDEAVEPLEIEVVAALAGVYQRFVRPRQDWLGGALDYGEVARAEALLGDPKPGLVLHPAAAKPLPNEKLQEVLLLLEKAPDRMMVNEVLNVVRPRLTAVPPPRVLTVRDLLFLPAEDLLDGPEWYLERVGRLSRAVLDPCWEIVDTPEHRALLTAIGERLKSVDPDDPRQLVLIGRPLWQLAASKIKATMPGHRPGDGADDELSRAEDLISRLWYMAEVLQVADVILEITESLPPAPIHGLSEADFEMLSAAGTRLAQRSLRAVRLGVQVLTARIARPKLLSRGILTIMQSLSASSRENVLQAATQFLTGQVVGTIQLVERRGDVVQDPAAAVVRAEMHASGILALESVPELRTDLRSRNHLRDVRTHIGRHLLDVVFPAIGKKLDEPPRSEEPDFLGAPPPDQGLPRVDPEGAALLIHRCMRLAQLIGVTDRLQEVVKKVADKLPQAAVPPGLVGPEAERSAFPRIRFLELVSGPDAADRKWREIAGSLAKPSAKQTDG